MLHLAIMWGTYVYKTEIYQAQACTLDMPSSGTPFASYAHLKQPSIHHLLHSEINSLKELQARPLQEEAPAQHRPAGS